MAEIYVEGKRLDVFEGFKFSFNYSIADVRHPEQRTTNYSKTIKCPATQNNDEIFGQIYDFNISNKYDPSSPNIDVNFNPNKKAEASVQADGIEVMRGSLQLRKVKRNKSDYIYEVVFVGKLVDIFGVLGEKQLNGFEFDEATQTNLPYIDFSEYNHFLGQSEQEQSWTAPYGEGYVYPMIDYGNYVGYDQSGFRKYFTTNFRPALYLKEIIDRIFSFAGFTYTSSFLSSAFFKRLIVPITAKGRKDDRFLFKAAIDVYNQNLVTLGWLEDETVVPLTVGNDSRLSQNGAGLALLCFSNDSTNSNFDNNTTFPNFGNYWVNPTPYPSSSLFSTGWDTLNSNGYTWRVPLDASGRYNLHCNIRIGWSEKKTFRTDDETWNELVTKIQDEYGLTQGTSMEGKLQIWRTRDGVQSVVAEEDVSLELNLQPDFIEQRNKDISVVAEDIEVLGGDYYFCALQFPQTTDGENATGFSPWMAYYDSSGAHGIYELLMSVGGFGNVSTFYNEFVEGAEVIETEYYTFNNNIPDVAMSDLLLSVINMFNLYVATDPNQDKNLIIETRDDFYEGGTVQDWTHKVDHSKELTLEPLALLTADEYEYTYAEDGDYYNERYQDSHGHAYGRARIDVDNDFLNNNNTTEVIFSPTPLVNDNPSNRIISKIYDSDIEEGAQPTDFNIRVLYYAGLIPSNPQWVHCSNIFPWNYKLEYPYAGHLTNPLAPAQDINFGVPNELFYSQNNYTGTLFYTNDNLFNRYHRRGLLEVTNKDSKLLTAYLYLEPLDIHKLDFRDQIVIDNSFWRINKIMDYNPFGEDLTKVELIKVITKEPLKFETTPIGGGGGGVAGPIRPITKRGKKNGNYSPLFGGFVRGNDNTVEDGVTSFMVQGNRNRVKKGSEDITIIGSDNTIEDGVTRVKLINTNGVTITESGVTFINNEQEVSRSVVDGGENTVRPLNGGTNIFTVDGGLNTVQAQFSETSIYILEGNN